MAATKEGARKTRDKNLAKDPLYYAKIGRKGGMAPRVRQGGFAAMPREKVQAAGRKGGSISKRRPAEL